MALETSTFANYRIDNTNPQDVYGIGAVDAGPGVIQDMALAFSHDLATPPTEENLGELMRVVGPAKELQKNIEGVQAVLGTTNSAVVIARSWVDQTGLLVPVERSYISEERSDEPIAL